LTTPYKINNTFWTYSELLPGTKVSIWQGYVPTTIYGTAYLMNADIHITCDNLSTKELMNSNIGLVVYPNPASNDVFISFDNQSGNAMSIELVDQLGRVVYSTSEIQIIGFNTIALNSSNVSDGMYSVRLQSGNNSITKRIIIRK
jgi:hypothetical protein